MKSPYTLSVGKSTYAISFAIFFWLMVALVLTYAFCLYAAFHVIGWSALIYLTVIPITINGKPLDPWHKYISSAIWLSLIACAVYFIYTLT